MSSTNQLSTSRPSEASTTSDPRAPPFEDSLRHIGLTLEEIRALPEERRNELAQRLGVVSWEPFTVQAIGTPGDVYAHVLREDPVVAPIPDDGGEDEVRELVGAEKGKNGSGK